MIPSAPLGTEAATGPHGPGAAASAALPAGPAAERRFRFELAAHPGSPAQARRLTRARLTGWSVCEDTCDTAALVVSELVTNAIVHTASSHIVCELYDRADLVRIAVRDEGCAPGQPQPSRRQPEDEHGRGLLLVDALCHAWGAQEHGPGLLVWADLPRTADDEAPGAPEPCDDLGWGARPKPGAPHEGPGDDGTDDAAPGDEGPGGESSEGSGTEGRSDETHAHAWDAVPPRSRHESVRHDTARHEPTRHGTAQHETTRRQPGTGPRTGSGHQGTGGERL